MGKTTASDSPVEHARETWLDVAPRFLEFYVRSILSPRKTLRPLIEPRRVSPHLTTLFLGGIALSQILVSTLGTSGLEDDDGNVAAWLRKIDPETLPAKALMAVTFLAIPIHAVFLRKFHPAREDTVNSCLAWMAAVIPTATMGTVLAAGDWCPEFFMYAMIGVGAWAPIHLARCFYALRTIVPGAKAKPSST